MKRIMAVYDVDPFYAERLAEFANQKEKTPFTVVAFTSLTRLKQFAEEQSVELLLAGDGVPEECLKELDIRQVMRLGEVKDMTAPDVPVIYKYQSSDAVLREVMACYQVQPEQMPLMAVGIRSTIIGICSPVGRCGKTGFGFTLGQIMARDSKVLFLGLEEYSALSRLTQTQYAATLTDLVYYYQSGPGQHHQLGHYIRIIQKQLPLPLFLPFLFPALLPCHQKNRRQNSQQKDPFISIPLIQPVPQGMLLKGFRKHQAGALLLLHIPVFQFLPEICHQLFLAGLLPRHQPHRDLIGALVDPVR